MQQVSRWCKFMSMSIHTHPVGTLNSRYSLSHTLDLLATKPYSAFSAVQSVQLQVIAVAIIVADVLSS